MNNTPISFRSPLSEDQIACVEMIKETLAQALEGKIDAIAIAVCMEGGFASALTGRRPGDLNLACDELKSKILDAVRAGPKTNAISRIVKARTM